MNAIDATAGGRDGSNLSNPNVDYTEGGRDKGAWRPSEEQAQDDFATLSKSELYSRAAQQLRADLQKSRPFEDGTIVRWTSVAVNGSRFHYAAVYAGGYWYTTSQRDTQHIQKKMSHEDFLHYLHSHGYSVINLGVAVDFEGIEL